ncbi:MAG: hypothetical protein AB7L28_22840 [Kofleriaceae bacterium]
MGKMISIVLASVVLGFAAGAAVAYFTHPDYGCVGRSCGGNAEIYGLFVGGPIGAAVGLVAGLVIGLVSRRPAAER